MVKRFVPGLEVADPKPDGRCAECCLYYQYGDNRTNPLEELRFMTHVAERETNKLIHYQSTDGFPNGVVVAFEGAADGATSVTLDFYCHLPFDLAQKEGVMSVSLDVEERIAQCLTNFAALATSVAEAGGVAALEARDDDVVIRGDTLPAGSGIVGDDGEELRSGGQVTVSRLAMEEAAREFEARVGRKPFAVEILKQLQKK